MASPTHLVNILASDGGVIGPCTARADSSTSLARVPAAFPSDRARSVKVSKTESGKRIESTLLEAFRTRSTSIGLPRSHAFLRSSSLMFATSPLLDSYLLGPILLVCWDEGCDADPNSCLPIKRAQGHEHQPGVRAPRVPAYDGSAPVLRVLVPTRWFGLRVVHDLSQFPDRGACA